jgi:hypothetical protein
MRPWQAAMLGLALLLAAAGLPARAAEPYEILALTDFPGIDGLYDFTRYRERGLGPDYSIIVTYDPKGPAGPHWVWLSKIGAPLQR